jgi:hypothetical protein
MNRRGFLASLTGLLATASLDPERLLWVPGAKTIFIPPVMAPELSLDEINQLTLKYLVPGIADAMWSKSALMDHLIQSRIEGGRFIEETIHYDVQ